MKRLILFFMIICLAISFASHIEAQTLGKDIYKVGINDVLEIRVLEHDELGTIATVTADGSITFPYLGNVYVKDKSLSEIEEEITKRLTEEYVKYPVVSVSLKTSISEKIYVYGEANKTGEVIFGEGMTVLNALSMVGGIPENGLYGGKVKVRRRQEEDPGFKDTEIDLKSIIEGSATADMLLQPDDILIVERDKFFIYGEVGKPGEYGIEDDMTVARALSVAGGIREDGLYGKVKVRRRQDGESGFKDIEIDLKGIIEGSVTADMLLQPDDILIVERNKTFFIYGEVVKPGQYVLEENMTVFKALSIGGGFTKWGSSSRVKVLRQTKGDAGFTTIKIKINDIIDGDASADINLQPGDIVVVSTGIF